MNEEHIFTIEYKLNGASKQFITRAAHMSSEKACHWAACDAGAAPIPKLGKLPIKLVSKPMAERYGITEVRWHGPGSVRWSESKPS